MRKNFKLLAAAAAIALATTGAGAAQAQRAPKAMAKIGGKPNLNGIWQVMSGANWNLEPHEAAEAPQAPEKVGAIGAILPGLGVTDGPIPYKPEAVAKRDELRKGVNTVDPEAACYLPGIPRATYIEQPFQIIQSGTGDILIAYQYASANRVIRMQPVEVPPIDTWMGTSYGSWEGDTLKVVTLAQSPGEVILPMGKTEQGVTWLDRSGNYLTNTATVTERFRPDGPDRIQYEVTVDDPTIYSKPWKISMPIYRRVEPKVEILDFRCVPFADKLLYGDLLADKDKYPKK